MLIYNPLQTNWCTTTFKWSWYISISFEYEYVIQFSKRSRFSSIQSCQSYFGQICNICDCFNLYPTKFLWFGTNFNFHFLNLACCFSWNLGNKWLILLSYFEKFFKKSFSGSSYGSGKWSWVCFTFFVGVEI